MRLINLITAIFMTAPFTGIAMDVKSLRCEALVNPIAIDNVSPHFSWINESSKRGDVQSAYQILVASSACLLNEENADLWNSGKVAEPSSVMVDYGGKNLKPGDFAFWKVRVWDKKGAPSAWSEPSYFGIGLLGEPDWKGCYIGRPDGTDKDNSPLFRKSFVVSDSYDRALLHVNSLGYHEAYVNGLPVSDGVLSPAVAQFNKRSQIVTYDITELLTPGKNEIILWLGRGWYNDGFPGVVEGGPFVRAQLDMRSGDTVTTPVATDGTWETAESGYSSFGSWWPHQFGGETVDARKIVKVSEATAAAASWKPVALAVIPPHAATPQMAELNRVRAEFHPVSVAPGDNDTWIYDMGKNFTGQTEIRFTGLAGGDTVRISYCDFLDSDNGFRDGLYEDYYIASGSETEQFVNKFNYKAYRYLKLSGITDAPTLHDITARLVHTDYSGTASFECSDPDMNAIYNMVSYTLRCLTLGGYMVDCPQVERLGYGGDGNASTPFVQTIYNMAPTYINWMQAWGDCMREDGSMPHTAPNPYKAGGGPYWCGFIITASWQSYLNYGDRRLLDRYYPYMKQWLGYVKKHTDNGLLAPWPDTDYRGWFLGDWATPAGIDQTDARSVSLVTNCYIAVCYDTMSKIADLLGLADEALSYRTEADRIRRLLQERYYDETSASYATGTQFDLIYPMLTGVTPENLEEKVRHTLLTSTQEKYNGHLATGLMGIPAITEWAVKNGEAEFMYGMLKKRDYPGFLYMIDNGATTTWEHWNGERSHIHNCYNSIGTWFYQALAGIRPDESAPGYRKVNIEPQPVEGISWVKASKDTPYGSLEVEWHDASDSFVLDIAIPVGCVAEVRLPYKGQKLTLNGKSQKLDKSLSVASGKHRIVCRK